MRFWEIFQSAVKLLEAEIDIFLGQADQSTNKKMEVTREKYQLKGLGVLD